MGRLSISYSFLVYCHLTLRCSLDGNLVKSQVSIGQSVYKSMLERSTIKWGPTRCLYTLDARDCRSGCRQMEDQNQLMKAHLILQRAHQ